MKKNKILILGASGMLGHTLFRSLGEREDMDVYGTVRNHADVAFFKDRGNRIITGVDAAEPGTVQSVIEQLRPGYVINCIGIIKQLKEAGDPRITITINSLFPHQLARYCKDAGCRLLHISTDCVFDGVKGNYTEADNSNAVDLYGRTKFLGEVSGQEHVLTIRTSMIGHEWKTRVGLVDWFLHQSGPVRGYARAIFTGFTTSELSRIIAEHIIPKDNLFGLYHVSAESISKFALLNLVSGVYKKNIRIESYDDFICDRSLNSDRFRQMTGYTPPDWEKMIAEMHQDYQKYYK